MEQLRKSTTTSGILDSIKEIKKFTDLKQANDFNKCVEAARLYFEDIFNH